MMPVACAAAMLTDPSNGQDLGLTSLWAPARGGWGGEGGLYGCRKFASCVVSVQLRWAEHLCSVKVGLSPNLLYR